MRIEQSTSPHSTEVLHSIEIKNVQDFNTEAIIDKIIECEDETWIPEWRASREALLKRINLFSQGFNVLYNTSNNEVVGFSTGMLVNYDAEKMKNWYDITGDGSLSTHDNNGLYFYIVSMAVRPKYSGKGYGSKLIKYQVELGKALGKKVIIGSRIPSYHNNPQLSPEEAVAQDWEVRFYNKHGGFEVKKIIPNFGDDPESLNYGVFMEVMD